MSSNLNLSVLLVAVSLASCATTPNSAYPSTLSEMTANYAPTARAERRKRDNATVGIFVEDIELGETEFENDDPLAPPTFDRRDIERERLGFRASFGGSHARGYVQLFREEVSYPGTEIDLIGIGGGVTGAPAVHRFQEDIRLIIPYRAGVNVALGEYETGVIEDDLGYLEFEGEFGVGCYVHGLQPSAGIYLTSLAGIASEPTFTDDTTFSGTNAGGYLQLLYQADHFPIYGSVRVMGGDVEGAVLAFGGTF